MQITIARDVQSLMSIFWPDVSNWKISKIQCSDTDLYDSHFTLGIHSHSGHIANNNWFICKYESDVTDKTTLYVYIVVL